MTVRPAWLAPALAYVESWLGYQMRATEQPGVALAVAYKGEVALDVAFGWADQIAGEPLTTLHRFRVASHSKSFTAAAIMKLRERGRLKLDDTAGQHVSGLHPDVAAATLTQLLSHTAGILRDGPDASYWVDRKPFLDESALRAELALAPAIPATTRLKYSNHGFGLLGLVIEALTGEPYGAWVKREIVDVVGLADTTSDVPANGPLARGHSAKTLLGRRLIFPGDQSTHALASATGFVSTAADLARFFGQLSPNAETSVLSVASRREMSRAQWEDPWAAFPQKYGLGAISGTFDGWDWFGHSGGFQGYITRSSVIPDHDLSLSCLTNAVDGMSGLWLDGALAILKRFEEGGAPSADLAAWSGRWWSAWGPTDLVPIGDKVVLAMPGLADPILKPAELMLTGKDEARISQSGAFANFGEPARLVRGGDGAVAAVQIGGGQMISEAALVEELVGRYEKR